MKNSRALLLAGLLCAPFAASAADGIEVEVKLATAQGAGQAIGTVVVQENKYGVLFTPKLSGLEPGLHGFHLHENPNCDPATNGGQTVPAGAAGGHYDPDGTGVHLGPYEDGHKGDLPPLYVDKDGKASLPVLAPRLKLDDVQRKALMVHVGGDNYSDAPQPLGGGGGRMACGVIGSAG